MTSNVRCIHEAMTAGTRRFTVVGLLYVQSTHYTTGVVQDVDCTYLSIFIRTVRQYDDHILKCVVVEVEKPTLSSYLS